MTSSSFLRLCIFGLIVFAGWPNPVCCQVADSLQTESGVVIPDSLATDFLIMPVANYSEKGEAHEVLLPRLFDTLDQKGVTYLASGELRPLLREHRIRSRGWIGLEDAQILREETQASYVLIVSWDVFKTENNPEIGLSMRVLDLEHLTLLDAVSIGLTGADFTKALGMGRISSISELADIAMSRAVDSIIPVVEFRNPLRSYRGCFQVALIPFDNFSETAYAGDIVTNIVLSRLLAEGYFVVEPGFVRELGLVLERPNRGGVDWQNARSLLASFEVCRVVTGAVQEFSTARGDPRRSVPQLALGIRVMSPRDGNLYMMEELQAAGDDRDGIFQGGRVHAIVPLANRMLKDFMHEVAKNNREDILYGDHDQ